MPEQTDIPISSFPDAESITNADKVTGLQGNANKNFTFSSILAWFVNAVKSAFVPIGRMINGKSLSSDVTLTASDVGARPNTWTPSAADVGAIPATAAGEPLGIAELGSDGKVPSSQLPAIPSQPSDIGAQPTITASGILKGDGAGGVSAATPGTDYQAPLTIDSTPTASSANPVQSGGVYTDVRTRVPNYGKGKNLLRNWYFVGGGTGRGVFPVNQRGQSSYATVDYTVDGWKLRSTGSSVVVNSGSITFNRGSGERADFFQILGTALVSQIYGKPVVLSILLGDGRFRSASFIWSSSSANRIEESDFNFSAGGIPSSGANFSTFYIRLFGTSIDIVAIQLELGSEQTLAHQENGTWVLNEIPDYEYELYRCITSTADPSDTYANKSLATEQQLAYVETGTTASRNYIVGEYFCWNGLLYRVTTAISNGGTITPGTNCVQTTLASQIRLSTATLTTNSGGTVSTGLNVSTGKILAAFATGYDISVYLNSSGVQGYFVKTAGTNTPASNVTISVTAVILNY